MKLRPAYFVATLLFIASLAVGHVAAAVNDYSVSPGDSVRVLCSTGITIEPESANAVTVLCAQAEATATAEPTPTDTATPTDQPSATPTDTATPTNTPTPAATAIPATPIPPTPTVAPSGDALYLTQAEIMALPMSGTAWNNVLSAANGSWGTPNLSDLNATHDVLTLAGALVGVRTNDTAMKQRVAAAIISAIGTEDGTRTLEVSRNIVSYNIAADLIDLKNLDPAKDAQWRAFIDPLRTRVFDSKTIISTHNVRPNNWGTMAGAARVSIDRYLGDTADLALAANVFKGWLGDRTAYAGFSYGTLTWQCDQAHPVGINPAGCTIGGVNVDGVLPDDQRRTSGGVTSNPPNENYVWEALQGAYMEAWMLNRAGYDVFNWSDQALLRAVNWQYVQNQYVPTGDDRWVPWLASKAYGTSYSADPSATYGKVGGWTAWTHQ